MRLLFELSGENDIAVQEILSVLKGESIDHAYLDSLPAVYEDEHVRHVRLDSELLIKIDGKTNRGVVMKPST